jgi:hypothetical protein|tara:strand:+ start:499 stop:1422 length:924 start_codon:yes stop_codon:yes gene_type:complete
MKYAIYYIPSTTFPKEKTTLTDGIICFKSNVKNDISVRYSNCTGLIISIDKHPNYFELLTNYVIAINLFRQEHVAVQWLSHLNKDINIVEISDENLDQYIQSKRYTEDRKFAYDEDYSDMEVHLIVRPVIKFSFIEIFNKVLKLEKDSFLDQTTRYLAINDSLIMTTNRIFDNALFKNATLFQIFESIMNEHEPVLKKEARFCDECKRPINQGLNKRINRFLKNKGIDQPEISKAIIKIAETRHKFFHSLKGKSHMRYATEILGEKTSGEISIKEEMKDGDGVFTQVHVLKAVVSIILLDELINYDT